MNDATCILDDCDKARYQNKRYCASHYMKAHRYGDPYFVVHRKFQDVTGRRFGHLVPMRRTPRGLWVCQCDCGNVTYVRIGDLQNGGTRTCGARPTHPYKDVVTYAGAHDRVVAVNGKASEHVCSDCSMPAQEWSYDHQDIAALTAQLGRYLVPYSLSPRHYQPRCIACHRKFDREHVVPTSET